MYPSPLNAYNLNNQSFTRQTITNTSQTNGVQWNQNEAQAANVGMSILLPNQQSNGTGQSYSSSNNNIKENGTKNNASKSSKKDSKSSSKTHTSTRSRKLSRQSSLETITTKKSIPLATSKSVGTLRDRIQQERRAHTMAPLNRISGPSSSPKAKMFASIIAPTESQAAKSRHATKKKSKTSSVSYPKSDVEMKNDDDAPIIVKVQYDPETGVVPSEDAVRRAIDNQLKRRSDKTFNKDPIIINTLGKIILPQIPRIPIRPPQVQVLNRPMVPFDPPFLRIPMSPQQNLQLLQRQHQISQQQQQMYHQYSPYQMLQQKPDSFPTGPQPSSSFPSMPPVHQPPRPFLPNRQVQAPRPFIIGPLLPSQNLSSARASGYFPPGPVPFKSINIGMATAQQATTISTSNTTNVQQPLQKRPQTVPSTPEVFRPPKVSDIPELSKGSLLSMLNQIPDLQGRQFNIEYAPSDAPEGYPIPLNFNVAGNTYPEPVVVNQLPNNIIQHVKSSNNPAITAALEATIRQEQHGRPVGQLPTTGPVLQVQQPTVTLHAAQPNQRVQKSPPASSNDSDSSTESSSSSSSEESEDVSLTKPWNNIPFVGPFPPTSSSQNQYR